MCLSLETLHQSHYKDWLPYFGGTIDLVNSVKIDLNEIVNFLTSILEYHSHSPALLDLFLSSDTSICSTMPFPSLGNSDHVVSVSIDFRINSKQDAPFHCISYDYSCAD